MTKEDKKLLLKDLSSRLPYGVVCYWRIGSELTLNLTEYNGQLTGINKVEIEDSSDYYYDCYFNVCNDSNGNSFQNEDVPVEIVKPYLRSMSSMTEEEFAKLKEYSGLIYDQLDLASFQNGTYKCLDFYLSEVPSYVVILVFDWLNAHHFDYRGLIEKGSAIEVTKENNPYGNL